MIIEVHNAWSYFIGIEPSLARYLHHELSVDTSGLEVGFYVDKKTGQQKHGLHYEKSSWSPYELDANRIPSGLIWRVFKLIPSSDIEIIDKRNHVVHAIHTAAYLCKALGIEARDYQLETVDHIFKHQRGIVNIATNGGKTEIMAMVVAGYPPETCYTIISPSITGLTEITERFDLRGISYTTIDSGNKEFCKHGINVCSLDSLRNMEDLQDCLKATDVLIWDECDDSGSSVSGWDVGMNCDAFVRVYLSGTPFTDNQVHNVSIVGIAGEEIVNIRNKYLIERGYSARPIVYFHSSLAAPISFQDTYPVLRKKFLNENTEFANRVIDDVELHLGEGVVILYEHKNHGRLLEKTCKKRRIKSAYIDGDSSYEDREDAKKRLLSGRVDVILASSIWNRALSFGYPRHWYYVGGLKASNRVLQRYGRALRKKFSGENVVYIHEWFIWGSILEKHSRIRYELCLKEEFEVVLVDKFLEDYLIESPNPQETPEFNNSDLALSAMDRVRAKMNSLK